MGNLIDKSTSNATALMLGSESCGKTTFLYMMKKWMLNHDYWKNPDRNTPTAKKGTKDGEKENNENMSQIMYGYDFKVYSTLGLNHEEIEYDGKKISFEDISGKTSLRFLREMVYNSIVITNVIFMIDYRSFTVEQQDKTQLKLILNELQLSDASYTIIGKTNIFTNLNYLVNTSDGVAKPNDDTNYQSNEISGDNDVMVQNNISGEDSTDNIELESENYMQVIILVNILARLKLYQRGLSYNHAN